MEIDPIGQEPFTSIQIGLEKCCVGHMSAHPNICRSAAIWAIKADEINKQLSMDAGSLILPIIGCLIGVEQIF